MNIQEELSIKAMTVSQIYSLFVNDKLIVNRKYQRKLCWSIEEKRNFIDTIIRGFPVPMFLLASTKTGQYEIIDGLQRIDAICTFISQRYTLKDGSFNLESMPDTIEQVRNASLKQRNPIIDSSICKSIANYMLPVSIFPAANESDVEEVFKRINSTGKHLSMQELRQVGIGTQFSKLVRILSSEIRGDISEDILLLRNMSNISLNNYRLDYSICLDDVFWVKNEIINKSEMRLSRDEEAIAYMLANMILQEEEKKPLSNQFLNKLYGYSSNPLEDTVPLETTQINNAIDRIGYEKIVKQFRMVMSCFGDMLISSGKSFRKITNISNEISDLILPFNIVFMAIYKLIIKQNKQCVNYDAFAKKIDGHCKTILEMPFKNNQSRNSAINAIIGLIQDSFSDCENEDPMKDDWSVEILNILNKSRSEQVLYDFKIGFVPFNKNKIDENMIQKVLTTLTSINNTGPNRTGYVIVGIADKESDAKKCKEIYGTEYHMVNGIALCGIEHDAIAINKSIDIYTHSIKEYIRNCELISSEYRTHILKHMKTTMLYKVHIIIFKTCYSEPVSFNDDHYLREYTDVHKLEGQRINEMFKNYYLS